MTTLDPIPGDVFRARLDGASRAAAGVGQRALFIGVGPDLRYLTGYEAMPLERLTMLVLATGAEPVLLAPRLELAAAVAGVRSGTSVVTWEETEDPYRLVAARAPDGGSDGDGARIGVSDRLWASHMLRLQTALPGFRFEPASLALRRLRMHKDEHEVERLRMAALAADRVVDRIAAGRLIGRTEADVAREVRELLVAEGHERAEFAIVASGPNAASPHHEATDRRIGPGEPIVLDIGGVLDGYASDVTRTLWVTGGDPAAAPDPEYRRLYEVLRGAQDEATASVRPGVPAERVDRVARDIITTAGYGSAFIHRTGHGIGLEGHEDPYLVAGNPEPLATGMAFSVEPGIYLEGRYGARIEDIVVCGPDGPIVLNETSRELRVVEGR